MLWNKLNLGIYDIDERTFFRLRNRYFNPRSLFAIGIVDYGVVFFI